jgi:hypothetical protein
VRDDCFVHKCGRLHCLWSLESESRFVAPDTLKVFCLSIDMFEPGSGSYVGLFVPGTRLGALISGEIGQEGGSVSDVAQGPINFLSGPGLNAVYISRARRACGTEVVSSSTISNANRVRGLMNQHQLSVDCQLDQFKRLFRL